MSSLVDYTKPKVDTNSMMFLSTDITTIMEDQNERKRDTIVEVGLAGEVVLFEVLVFCV